MAFIGWSHQHSKGHRAGGSHDDQVIAWSHPPRLVQRDEKSHPMLGELRREIHAWCTIDCAPRSANASSVSGPSSASLSWLVVSIFNMVAFPSRWLQPGLWGEFTRKGTPPFSYSQSTTSDNASGLLGSYRGPAKPYSGGAFRV
jgi:hypothetical protein